MAETIKERTLEFIKYKGINMKTFEQRCELSSGYVTSMRKGFGTNKLNNVLKAFPELNRDWLLYGEGDMLKPQSNAKMVGGIYAAGGKDEGVLMVDFIPVSATASFIDNLAEKQGVDLDKYPLIPAGNESTEADALRIFEVDGDSMYPTIPSGALILVKEIPEKSWHYAEGVVVAVYDSFVVVKRILKNDLLLNNCIVLGSDNKDYGQMTVPLSDLRALYKAKRIISSTIR